MNEPVIMSVNDSRDVFSDLKDENGNLVDLTGSTVTLFVYKGRDRVTEVMHAHGDLIASNGGYYEAKSVIPASTITQRGRYFMEVVYEWTGVRRVAIGADLIAE